MRPVLQALSGSSRAGGPGGGPSQAGSARTGASQPGVSLTRGRLEMSRRVLGELAADNKVLADIIAPLMQVIGGNDPAVIAERAARALSDFDETIGRPPRPEDV